MNDDAFLADIQIQLKHQTTWRRVMSGAYFVSTAVAILASGAATVMSGLGFSAWGAVLAGAATVFFGLEKAMLFREKWTHHLNTCAELEALRVEYIHGGLDIKEAAEKMTAVVMNYARKLPVDRRKSAPRAS